MSEFYESDPYFYAMDLKCEAFGVERSVRAWSANGGGRRITPDLSKHYDIE